MSAHTADVVLTTARYGKDKVRVFRVKRESDGVHYIVEYNVSLLIEGDIDVSYTKADNSVVVATDSMKNITYYLAKVSDYILVPEHFALHLGTHVLSKYAHLRKASITIEQLRWTRITVSGQDKPHAHAFHRDGDDKRVIQVVLEKTDGKSLSAKVTAGITDLLVLKSTGSAFEGFIRDEYTTLVEVPDRILSTSVDLEYHFAPVSIPVPTDPKLLDFSIPKNLGEVKGTVWDALGVAERARQCTLDLFATDESASVQATLFKMGERVITENAGVDQATYKLPNKHYIPVDMSYLGVDNLTPATAEVFVPVAAPSGLISATISRKQA
ncbi:uricase [Boletus edulis BED1]|uniref:Uricase n=1 Tax=Boletus edulis BED1 TaxID=1328754 RepID=A0AAD4BWR9_BOLED|nr:uricase [Boletus edulis BED1]